MLDVWNLFRALAWMFSEATRTTVAAMSPVSTIPRSAASWFIFGLVVCLSTPVVRNMASKKQTMNRIFEPLRIVNTYGAFGSVSKVWWCDDEKCWSKTCYFDLFNMFILHQRELPQKDVLRVLFLAATALNHLIYTPYIHQSRVCHQFLASRLCFGVRGNEDTT